VAFGVNSKPRKGIADPRGGLFWVIFGFSFVLKSFVFMGPVGCFLQILLFFGKSGVGTGWTRVWCGGGVEEVGRVSTIRPYSTPGKWGWWTLVLILKEIELKIVVTGFFRVKTFSHRCTRMATDFTSASRNAGQDKRSEIVRRPSLSAPGAEPVCFLRVARDTDGAPNASQIGTSRELGGEKGKTLTLPTHKSGTPRRSAGVCTLPASAFHKGLVGSTLKTGLP